MQLLVTLKFISLLYYQGDMQSLKSLIYIWFDYSHMFLINTWIRPILITSIWKMILYNNTPTMIISWTWNVRCRNTHISIRLRTFFNSIYMHTHRTLYIIMFVLISHIFCTVKMEKVLRAFWKSDDIHFFRFFNSLLDLCFDNMFIFVDIWI